MESRLSVPGDGCRSSDFSDRVPAMRIRFTIRSMMLATTAVSIAWAMYAYHERIHYRRLQAMSQIERDSGFVSFRNAQGGIPIDVTDDVRRTDRVESIYLANSKLDDRTLDLLSELDDASFVSFNSSVFADRHVGFLDDMTHLHALQLNGTNVTEVGLAHLAQRHLLTQLTLNDTAIDDRAVDALSKVHTLRHLQIRHTNVSPTGLARLRSELPFCKIDR
jgi:hypothetical protein